MFKRKILTGLVCLLLLLCVSPVMVNADCADPACAAAAAGHPDISDSVVHLKLLLDDTLKSLNFKFDSSVTIGTILTQLLLIVYGIAGMGFLVYLIYGGFAYLTSAGDPKKAEMAKTVLTHAVIGFFLIVVAFWITQIISFVFNLGSGFPG